MTDFNTHTFTTNKRSERYLVFITVVCICSAIALIGVFLSTYPISPAKDLAFLSLIILFVTIVTLTLAGAWKSYWHALETQVTIDPIKRHFVYTHRGKTIEFDADDVTEWYDNIGLKIGFGKLTRLIEHDSVMILKSGEVIFLPSWIWDGDYSWLYNGGSYEHNIKFYLEAHQGELGLPECKFAWTYKYMFPNQ